MTTSSNFENIKNFFSSYFHEDWVMEAENTDQVIASYLAHGWSSKELRDLAKEILLFTDAYKDDTKLERDLFSELGCYYQPSEDKISARMWLQHVASTLIIAAELA